MAENLYINAKIDANEYYRQLKELEIKTKSAWQNMDKELTINPKVWNFSNSIKKASDETLKLKNTFTQSWQAAQNLWQAISQSLWQGKVSSLNAWENSTKWFSQQMTSAKIAATALGTQVQTSLWNQAKKATDNFKLSQKEIVSVLQQNTQAEIDMWQVWWDQFLRLQAEAIKYRDRLQAVNTALKWTSWVQRSVLQTEANIIRTSLAWVEWQMRSLQKTAENTANNTSWFMHKLSKSIQTWFLTTFWVFSIAWAIWRWIRAFTSYLKESVATAISFESAFAWVRKTIEASEYEFANFNNTLKDLTKNIPLTYEELAKIAELWWQMGVPLEQLWKFVEILSALSVSTDLWLEDAALQFSRIASIVNLDFSQIDRLGSTVVALGNDFAATESEITNFLTRIAGTGSLVWLTTWWLAGIATAVTAVGIQAEKWWTAINKMTKSIEEATINWGSDLDDLWKLTWHTADEFAKLRDTNADEAFVQVVEWIAKSWDKAIWIVSKLFGSWERLQETVLNLSEAWWILRRAVERGNEAFIENIALLEEAAKRYWTAESKIAMMNNQVREQQQLLWDKLLPTTLLFKEAVLGIITSFTSLIEWFWRMSWAIKTLIVWSAWWWLAALWAALFSLNPILWTIVISIAALTWAIYLFSNAANSLDTPLKKLEAWIASLNSSIEENEKSLWLLWNAYTEGRISIEEYRRELEKLAKEQASLEEAREKEIKNLAAYKSNVDRISSLTSILWQTQQENIELTKLQRESQNNYIEKVKELNIELSKTWDVDSYNNKLKELKETYWQEKKAIEDSIRTNLDYTETIWEAIPIIQTLNARLDDSVMLKNFLNDINLSLSWDAEQIKLLTQELAKLKGLAMDDYMNNVANSLSLFEETRKKYENSWFLWKIFYWAKLWVLTPQVENINKQMEENNKWLQWTLWKLIDGVQANTNKKVWDILSVDSSELKTENSLKQQLTDIKQIMWEVNVESEDYNKLAIEKEAIEKRLLALSDDTVDPWISLWWDTEWDLLEAQLKLLEKQAELKIKNIKDILTNEELAAKEILKVNERLEEEKSKLQDSYVTRAIDNADEIIAKYEELREKWQDAFADLVDRVEDASKSINDLTDDISKTQEKLDNLEKDKSTDLSDRYVQITEDIKDLNKELEKYKYNILTDKDAKDKAKLEEDLNALLKEQVFIKKNLTDEEITQAQLREWETESDKILREYTYKKSLLSKELDDYKDLLAQKLIALWKFYWDAYKLQQEYWNLWISFSEQDLEKLVNTSENMSTVPDDLKTSYTSSENDQKRLIEEQVQAKEALENIKLNIQKLTDAQIKNLWNDNLNALLNKLSSLQSSVAWEWIWNNSISNKTITLNQNNNISNDLDIALVADKIRKSITL